MSNGSDDSTASESGQLVNISVDLAGLAAPATTLIEKIASGAGHVYAPVHERRMARAEREAREIRVDNQLELAQMIAEELGVSTERALTLTRVIGEKSVKLSNRDEIIEKALPRVDDDAEPDEMDDDWILNFLSSCELTSDDELQLAWAKILSGEANSPGKFSKRTIGKLSNLDKVDAELFQNVCQFRVVVGDDLAPLITDYHDSIYESNEVSFRMLKHLDSIGLITLDTTGYRYESPPRSMVSGENFQFAIRYEHGLRAGQVMFSSVGQQLSAVVDSESPTGFKEHVQNFFEGQSEVEEVELVN